jgi:general secretion pathway protein H
VAALSFALRIAPAPPASQRAFTLVEMLVVLLLLGIAAALVVSQLAPDDRRTVEHEATRVASSLEHAIAAAQWRGETLGISAEGSVVRFWRRDGDGTWSVLTDDDVLAARAPAAGLAVESTRFGTAPVAPNAILPLSPSGRNEPLELVVRGPTVEARVTSDALDRVSFVLAGHT